MLENYPPSAANQSFWHYLETFFFDSEHPVSYPWQHWIGICALSSILLTMITLSAFDVVHFDTRVWLINFFLGGFITVILVVILTYMLSSAVDISHPSMAGVTEELTKFIVSYISATIFNQPNHNDFQKHCLFTTLTIALGFSFLENILYFETYGRVLSIRTNPGHMVFSGIWGMYMGPYIQGKISFLDWIIYFLCGVVVHA